MAKHQGYSAVIALLIIIVVLILVNCVSKPNYTQHRVEGFKENLTQPSDEEGICLKKYLPAAKYNKVLKLHEKNDIKGIFAYMREDPEVDHYMSRCRLSSNGSLPESEIYKKPNVQEKTLYNADKQRMETQSAMLTETFENPYATYPPAKDQWATFDGNDPYDRKNASLNEGFIEPFCGQGKFRLYDKYGCCKKRFGISGGQGYSQCVLTGEGMQPCN